MYLLPEFLGYNNDLWLKLTGQNVSKTPSWVFSKILEFALSITKKLYFDPCLGVSIKMYLLPGFISHTYEIFLNSLKSAFLAMYQNKRSTQNACYFPFFSQKNHSNKTHHRLNLSGSLAFFFNIYRTFKVRIKLGKKLRLAHWPKMKFLYFPHHLSLFLIFHNHNKNLYLIQWVSD